MKRERTVRHKFFFIVGTLVVLLSGGCSGVYVFGVLEGDSSYLYLALMYGGPPMVWGAFLIWAGRGRRAEISRE